MSIFTSFAGFSQHICPFTSHKQREFLSDRLLQVAGDSTPEGNCFGDPEVPDVPADFSGFHRWVG